MSFIRSSMEQRRVSNAKVTSLRQGVGLFSILFLHFFKYNYETTTQNNNVIQNKLEHVLIMNP